MSTYQRPQTTQTPAREPKANPKVSGISSGVKPAAGGASSAKVAELEEQVKELKDNNAILDKERNFYFEKLTLMENCLTKSGFEKMKIGEGLIQILYAAEEDQVEVNEQGDIIITAEGKRTVFNAKDDGAVAER